MTGGGHGRAFGVKGSGLRALPLEDSASEAGGRSPVGSPPSFVRFAGTWRSRLQGALLAWKCAPRVSPLPGAVDSAPRAPPPFLPAGFCPFVPERACPLSVAVAAGAGQTTPDPQALKSAPIFFLRP